MKERLMSSVQQGEETVLQQARGGNVLADLIQRLDEITDVVDADDRIRRIADRLVTGDVGPPQDVDYAVVRFTAADRCDRRATRIEDSADGAGAIRPFEHSSRCEQSRHRRGRRGSPFRRGARPCDRRDRN